MRSGAQVEAYIYVVPEDTAEAITAVGEITEIVHDVHNMSTSIASAVEEQSATTGEIGHRVAEAAKGSTVIAESIASVASTAQATLSGAQSTANAAHELARMASELRQLVGAFHYTNGGPEASTSETERTHH